MIFILMPFLCKDPENVKNLLQRVMYESEYE